MAVEDDVEADASLVQANKRSPLFKTMLKENRGGHHDHATPAVRVAIHKGHRIEVKTSYEVRVDGKKVAMSFAPDQDGSVAYHAIPNVAFASAMDLVRCVIDTFPADFPPRKRATPSTAPGGPPHHRSSRKRATASARKAGR